MMHNSVHISSYPHCSLGRNPCGYASRLRSYALRWDEVYMGGMEHSRTQGTDAEADAPAGTIGEQQDGSLKCADLVRLSFVCQCRRRPGNSRDPEDPNDPNDQGTDPGDQP